MKLPGIDYLNSLDFWDFKSQFTISAIKEALNLFNNPQDKPKSVHIAGTNGKGTVAAGMSSILSAAGHNVGLNTSPHLSCISERFIINGKLASLKDISEAALKIKGTGIKLSYHEAITATAFVLFEKLDWIVIEVGLGGLVDASNVIKKPEVTIITSISYDHEHVLGSTLKEIAFQKAGIIKENVPVIIGNMADEALEVIYQVAKKRNAPVVRAELLSKNYSYISKHKQHNDSLSTSAAGILNLSKSTIEKGLNRYSWPGRLENIVFGNKKFILDAAHNPESIDALAAYLDEQGITKLNIIFAVLKTKNWKYMLNTLSKYIVNWNIVSTGVDASVSPEEISQELQKLSGIDIQNISVFNKDYQSAVENGIKGNLTVLVTGSIYMLGEVRPLLLEEEFSLW